MENYIIQTKRLNLRKLNENDFDNLKAIICDDDTMKYYPKPYDDAGVNKWLNWNYDLYAKYGFGLWAVELKDGTFIGDCGITIQNIDNDIVYEIGYHLNKQYWHQGYAIEAAKACKEWFFLNTDIDEVYSYMNAENINSYNLAIRNGMKLIKEYYEENVLHKVYKITRNEFLSERVYYVLDKHLLKTATFGFSDKEEVASALNNIKYKGNDLIINKYVKFINEKQTETEDLIYVEGEPILLTNSIEDKDIQEYDEEFDLSIKAYENNDDLGIERWNNYLKSYEDKFLNFEIINK